MKRFFKIVIHPSEINESEEGGNQFRGYRLRALSVGWRNF
jgi:hypothetical protein